ncbi:MAG: sigma-70 family RNA polymerase sigma factor [Spirochaetales bacterium]|nr:sigma-70 family RNA polymerase sigma factor [Spirochaetales bacterium]
MQATWERALSRLHQLRENDKFTSWICRICRNILIEARRKDDREDGSFEDELSIEPGLRDRVYEGYDGLVRLSLRMLPEEQRQVVQLRFFCSLSYAQIGLICGIEEKLVKSRLYEAKKSLKSHLKNLYDGLEVSQRKLNRMEEYVMNEFDKATLGAEVFCRLSLDSQKRIVACVKETLELTPELLEEIGKTKQGRRFAEEFFMILRICFELSYRFRGIFLIS